MDPIHENAEELWAISVPEAGRRLGLGRNAAYGAAARGEIPTIRLGRKLVVSVAMLDKMLGR